MSSLLSETEVIRRLGEVTGWVHEGSTIRRTIECRTFPSAIALVVGVADEAERMDHHPDIDIRWRAVTFTLSTHSAGGLTQLDFELAHRINALATAAQ